MDRIVITGGRPLRGRVKIGGAKNAALAILCAAFLCENEVVLDNIPNISDVRFMLEIVGELGAATDWDGPDTLRITPPLLL